MINLKWLYGAILLVVLVVACQPAGSNQATSTPTPTSLDTAIQSAYLQKGNAIAKATFTALSGNLKAALEKGGVPHAVAYCNLVAYPLVDSLSTVHQATIRRTSSRIRNPKDAPNDIEKMMLQSYSEQHKKGAPLAPKVQQLPSGDIAFFKPIMIDAPCLNCHGTIGEVVTKENYAHITDLYPEDQAVGYKMGDLRGMWSITFDQKAVEEQKQLIDN